jgi:hypothetical protein
MVLTAKTDYLEAVKLILQQTFSRAELRTPDAITITVAFDTDHQYREIVGWASDAFGCGLIVSWEIARD